MDIDPVAIAHSKAILAGNPYTTIVDADLREPEKILAHDDVQRLIDFSQPTALLLMVVLHFLTDAEDPRRVVATLRDALAPGSFIVLGHGTGDGSPATVGPAKEMYNRSVATQVKLRSHAEIMRFFDGFELVEPGLVYVPLCRPDSPADVPDDPARFWCQAGVGRKP